MTDSGRSLENLALRAYRQWRLYIEPERLRMRSTLRRWIRRWPPGSTVLEVGGGTSFLRPVVEVEVPGARYFSGDIAPTDETAVVLDATSLPVRSASVDAVMALEVLEHLSEPRRLLEEASRVLRPGGQLILTVPFMFGVHDFRDYHRFTPLGLTQMLSKCDLRLIETVQRGGTFVASTGLVRNLILNAIVGRPHGWRAQGRRKKLLWVISSLILTPWTAVTWLAYGLDGLLDGQSQSPPGYFFLCERIQPPAA